MQNETDVIIIGAGVVGLACAAAVARPDRNVYVLEKNDSFGQEVSSRHSGVIHSGIYYPTDSLKTKLCLEGNRLLYELCRQYNISHKRLTKLIVAVDEAERTELEALYAQGIKNGLRNLRMLSHNKIKEMEPNVVGTAAIFSEYTGIIDSHNLMEYYLSKARDNGAQVAFQTEVIGLESLSDGWKVTVAEGSGRFSVTTTVVINCAGLYSDRIAAMAGIDITRSGYKLYYCKGEYFSVGNGKNRLVSRLVYPVPPPNLVGVGEHVTLDLDGRMRIGPSTEYVDKIEYSVNPEHKQLFYEGIKRFLPAIEYNDLEPEMSGIRPKVQGPEDKFRDYIIREESDKGLPGLINLVGIESPGLTASPAIARYVKDLVGKILS